MTEVTELPKDACTLADLHKASRLLTIIYNEHLKDTGATIKQLSMLKAVLRLGPLDITTLSSAMAMERTSTSRLLNPLIARGLLASNTGSDRRQKNISITMLGREMVSRCQPLWRQAQDELMSRLGETKWSVLNGAIADLLHELDRQ